MNFIDTNLPGVLRVEPDAFTDARGYFLETWKTDTYVPGIGAVSFVQDNLSRSSRGVLRGLHFQMPREQGKLVWAVRGCIFDVAVDVRPGSPTFGRWTGAELSDDNHHQLWIPGGFAHGFLTLSDVADVAYKCTETYAPACEHTLIWNDPDIAIAWPACGLDAPRLSDKDAQGHRLSEWSGRLPAQSTPGAAHHSST